MSSNIPDFVIAGSRDGRDVIFKWDNDLQKMVEFCIASPTYSNEVVNRLNNSFVTE